MKPAFAVVLALFATLLLSFTSSSVGEPPMPTGEDYTGPITPATGHTKINLTSTDDIKVVAVLKKDGNGIYKPVDSALWASNPSNPDKKPVITFVNPLESGETYKVKYEWYSSKSPKVTTSTS